MKIYDEYKTKKLSESELDFEKGYLINDKLFIAHHEAKSFIAGKTVEQRVIEFKAQNQVIATYDTQPNKFFLVTKAYVNGEAIINPSPEQASQATGKEVEELHPIEEVPAQEAYDEYEDIQVYIPYTAQELEERRLAKIRLERELLLTAFDKWEKAVMRGRELEDETVMRWYQDLLDLKQSAFENVPERVKYYLQGVNNGTQI